MLKIGISRALFLEFDGVLHRRGALVEAMFEHGHHLKAIRLPVDVGIVISSCAAIRGKSPCSPETAIAAVLGERLQHT